MMLKSKNLSRQRRDPFESLFDHLFTDTLADRYANDDRGPRTNIAESEGSYEFSFELPGVAESDIEVQLHENVLSVTAHRADAREADEGEPQKRWHRVEHRYGEPSRAISLPKDAAEEGVEAVHKNGVLTVTVLKQAAAQPAKIAVRAE